MSAGEALLSTLAEATGLPEEPIQDELGQLIAKHGLSSQQLTLEDLRTIMADYLQEVLVEAKETYSED